MRLIVKDRKTNETYDALVQSVDLNFNGKYILRYSIGIQGHNEFHFLHCGYDNDDFNKRYEVIKEVGCC